MLVVVRQIEYEGNESTERGPEDETRQREGTAPNTHEMPSNPTLPVDQLCSLAHSITSAKSLLV